MFVLAISVLYPHASADAALPREGDVRFKTTCNFVKRLPDDPIVHPNLAGMSHLHEFFGNKTITANTTTYAQLMSSTTTCNDALDKAAYWAPTVYTAAGPLTPTRVTAYYRRGSKLGTIQPYPDGLKVIAGWKMGSTAPVPLEQANWHCGHADYATPSFSCTETGGWSMQIRFPDCWNGTTIDSADHRSHMSYPTWSATVGAMVCDAAHPVPVPQLELNVNFGTIVDGKQLTGLSSGGLNTIHADFFNGWDRARLIERINTCLNGLLKCPSGG